VAESQRPGQQDRVVRHVTSSAELRPQSRLRTAHPAAGPRCA